MSRITPTHLWQLAKPYLIIGRIAVLVLGSLAYLQLMEVPKKFSKATKVLDKTNSNDPIWDQSDIIDLR